MLCESPCQGDSEYWGFRAKFLPPRSLAGRAPVASASWPSGLRKTSAGRRRRAERKSVGYCSSWRRYMRTGASFCKRPPGAFGRLNALQNIQRHAHPFSNNQALWLWPPFSLPGGEICWPQLFGEPLQKITGDKRSWIAVLQVLTNTDVNSTTTLFRSNPFANHILQTFQFA